MFGSWKKGLGAAVAVAAVLGLGAKIWCHNALDKYAQTAGLILEYHSVGEQKDWDSYMVVAPKVFEHHLQKLQELGYHMVTVAQLTERLRTGASVDKYVAISFDDGYKDNYTHALPLLKKYNAKATFHLIEPKIGGSIYMDAAQIRELLQAGMEIGSHTMSHHQLAEIDPKYLEWEIGVSKYALEKRFPGLQVRTLAYPNGSVNAQVIAALKKYGYEQALTGHTGSVNQEQYREHPMELNRLIVIDDGRGQYYFEGLLRRGYRRSMFLEWGIDLGE